MKQALLALFLCPALAGPAVAQATATSRDSAPAVRSARALYREVEAAIAERRLTRHDTTITCPRDGLDAHGAIFVDPRRRVRRLDTERGTDDHAEGVATYFDTLGRPRFAFVRRGAVNGTHQDERVYYDERGHVVRRRVRRVDGPGYLFDTLSVAPRVATWVHDLCR